MSGYIDAIVCTVLSVIAVVMYAAIAGMLGVDGTYALLVYIAVLLGSTVIGGRCGR